MEQYVTRIDEAGSSMNELYVIYCDSNKRECPYEV